MGLKRQTYLHDTPAKQDQTNSANQAENKIAASGSSAANAGTVQQQSTAAAITAVQ